MKPTCSHLMPEFLETVKTLPQEEQQAVLRVCEYLAIRPLGLPLPPEQLDELFKMAFRAQ